MPLEQIQCRFVKDIENPVRDWQYGQAVLHLSKPRHLKLRYFLHILTYLPIHQPQISLLSQLNSIKIRSEDADASLQQLVMFLLENFINAHHAITLYSAWNTHSARLHQYNRDNWEHRGIDNLWFEMTSVLHWQCRLSCLNQNHLVVSELLQFICQVIH